ncbi:MAG: type VI secretion system baseplate subunit TssK [Tepidisphaera sp.]|nr:type VI secretion system baseplate subunit TssK [Tepidisphaera sp.]
MSNFGHIHWHEGLFLQPHHLQVMQRDLIEASWRERRLGWSYPYGVVEMRVSTDALENMLVRVDRLRAIMPSGLEIDIPGNTDLPALDIKRVFQASSGSFLVGLGVPLWQMNRANTVEIGAAVGGGGPAKRAMAEEAKIKRLYRVAETSRTDENTGENSQAMMVRRINARLVVEGDDMTDLEVLPLLRITHTADEQSMPRPDPDFIPPCLVIGASPRLRNLVRDLGNQIDATRKELVNQMTRGGFVIENLKGPQFMQLLRLRTLSRYAATMPTLAAGGVGGAGTMAPLDAYLMLRELLGELAALSPERDPFDAPKFDHDNPGPVFMELDKKIRPLLRGDVQKRFIQVPFVKDGAAISAALTDEHLTQPNGYFVGIKTKMDPSSLGKLVEDQDKFKLMPKSMIKLNIYGIKLGEDRHPPLELPSSVDLHYFRVDVGASQKMWERVAGEKAMSIRWPELEPLDYQDVSLYMTLP